jgi:hypothetical protein
MRIEAEAVEQRQDDARRELVGHIRGKECQVEWPTSYVTPIEVEIELLDGG